jgi:hypothetical protein
MVEIVRNDKLKGFGRKQSWASRGTIFEIRLKELKETMKLYHQDR